MQAPRKHLLLSTTLVLLSLLGEGLHVSVVAQDMQSSPISRYGYGVPAYALPLPWRGMGGVGLALSSPSAVNFSNPAAFASTDSLSFLLDVATSVHGAMYRSGLLRKPSLQGGIDYIATQFPVWGDRVAVSAGIVPDFYTGYGMARSEEVGGATEGVKYTQTYKGRGSLQHVYLGVGAKTFAGMSVGVSLKYLFGSETHTCTRVPNFSQLTQSMETHTIAVKGIGIDVGLQYQWVFTGRKGGEKSLQDRLILGAVYSPRLPIRPTVTQVINRNVGSQTRPDIQSKHLDLSSATPHKIGVGLSWVRPARLALSADVRTSLWRGVPNLFANDQVSLQDSYYVAAGVQRLSDPYSSTYGRMVAYSAGVNFSSSYMDLPHIGRMQTVGASLGVSLPVLLYGLERNSIISLSLEYKHSLSSQRSAYGSDMWRLTMGISFNETWFRKLKIY